LLANRVHKQYARFVEIKE